MKPSDRIREIFRIISLGGKDIECFSYHNGIEAVMRYLDEQSEKPNEKSLEQKFHDYLSKPLPDGAFAENWTSKALAEIARKHFESSKITSLKV